jgi:hypothetical protein
MEIDDYKRMKAEVLQRRAASGDSLAAGEIARRSAAGQVERKTGPAAPEREPRRLVGFERPLASSRYNWWPPQVSAPSYEMFMLAKRYWDAQREKERGPAAAPQSSTLNNAPKGA